MSSDTRKVVIAGCMKDCAERLPAVLDNVERLATLYDEAAFIFVENDSQDSTKAIIQSWCNKTRTAELITLDGMLNSIPLRTVRLEKARNQYLSRVLSAYRDYDHLVVLDCDEVNSDEVDLGNVRRAISFLDSSRRHAGVFANQMKFYYDIWAFRHPANCPGDVWEEVFDCAVRERLSDADAYKRTLERRLFFLPEDGEPLAVDSAFGGFGIYKIASILKNKRSYLGYKLKNVNLPGYMGMIGWQSCEHVEFHKGFREQGEELFVLPFLINYRPNGNAFSPSFYRTLLFDPALIAVGKAR